jgi:hypothetical protein
MTRREPQGPIQELVSASRKLRASSRKVLERLLQFDFNAVDSFGAAVMVNDEVGHWHSLAIDTVGVLRDIGTTAATASEAVAATYPHELRLALEALGMKVSGDESLPIIDGIVYVEISTRRGTISINGRPQKDLRLHAIAQATKKEYAQLLEAISTPAAFLSNLWAAYKIELALRGKSPGSQVETLSLLKHILLQRQSKEFLHDARAGGLREYPATLFRADLYRLLASAEFAVDGVALRYTAGANTDSAVFMLDPALGRPSHIGRIWFQDSEETLSS